MTREELHKLFQLDASNEADTVLILCPQASARLMHTCRFIFEHVLNINFRLTPDEKEYHIFVGAKLNYSLKSRSGDFFIAQNPFINNTFVDAQFKPEVKAINGITVLFPDKEGELGFDLFSAVFYCISLYPEWQHFDPDNHHRYELKTCWQFKLNEHKKPLVNYWIRDFAIKLKEFFPQLKLPSKSFRYISTIDVDNLYAYKNKGFVRTTLAMAKDFLSLNFRNLSFRWKVIAGLKNDPFDVYEQLANTSNRTGIPLFFFFLQRSNTPFDRTINPKSGAFEPIFNLLKKKEIIFGIHPSYNAYTQNTLMEEECNSINTQSQTTVNLSRQHYLRWDAKLTPDCLIKNGIIADFTMGFASGSGYRASTFTPFYYFDLMHNESTELLLVPFAAMDGSYFIYSKTSATEAEDELLQMAEEARQLRGMFITVFHERTFHPDLYPGFSELYYRLHEELKS